MREEENIFFDDAGGWDKDGAAFLLHAINPLRLKTNTDGDRRLGR